MVAVVSVGHTVRASNGAFLCCAACVRSTRSSVRYWVACATAVKEIQGCATLSEILSLVHLMSFPNSTLPSADANMAGAFTCS